MEDSQNEKLPLVSVVVPVYNVETYLKKCIDTLKIQTYPNYEVILVDDGSTDDSGKLCDVYAADDNRIKVYHKKNGGLSDARNYGVERAEGEYICFVDSDDYVSNDYVEYLYTLKRKKKADIAVAKLTQKTGAHHFFESRCGKEGCLVTEDALLGMLYGKTFGVSACGKIFPKELVKKYPFPKGVLYEDLAVMYKIVGDCKRVAYGNKDIYLHRVRYGSIRHQPLTEAHFYGLTAAQEELDYIEKWFPEVVSAAKYRYVYKIIEYLPCLLQGTKEEKKMFQRLKYELTPYYRNVMKDRNVLWSVKIRCFTIMMGYLPSVFFWKIIERIQKRRFSE